MEAPAFKFLFEHILSRAKKRYSFKLENFVILNNHIHMIIVPGENESLSRIMQWILSVFAMNYNKLTGRSGHFWGTRFYSAIIENSEHYGRVSDYIDMNPVSAGLAAYPGEWPFCMRYFQRNKLACSFHDPPESA